MLNWANGNGFAPSVPLFDLKFFSSGSAGTVPKARNTLTLQSLKWVDGKQGANNTSMFKF